MQSPTDLVWRSALLEMPRELRDAIFSYLVFPQHVYTSSSKPSTKALHLSNKDPETYIDSRIYFPARPPANILGTCRQLRAEYLEFHAHLLNASKPVIVTDSRPIVKTTSNLVAARNNNASEERTERDRDGGSVRITLEINRPMSGSMGYYTPSRTALSPRFLALLPLMNQTKKVKFLVWAGFDWWKGTRDRPRSRRGKGRFKRTASDQTDELERPTGIEDTAMSLPVKEPNALSTAIEAVLQHLPLVEEITVDILIYASEYWNWDLPDVRYEGLRPWLESPISTKYDHALKKVFRRFSVSHAPYAPSIVFYHQLEIRDASLGLFRVSEGSFEVRDFMESLGRSYIQHLKVPEEWHESPEEPALTMSYDRDVGASRHRLVPVSGPGPGYWEDSKSATMFLGRI